MHSFWTFYCIYVLHNFNSLQNQENVYLGTYVNSIKKRKKDGWEKGLTNDIRKMQTTSANLHRSSISLWLKLSVLDWASIWQSGFWKCNEEKKLTSLTHSVTQDITGEINIIKHFVYFRQKRNHVSSNKLKVVFCFNYICMINCLLGNAFGGRGVDYKVF